MLNTKLERNGKLGKRRINHSGRERCALNKTKAFS